MSELNSYCPPGLNDTKDDFCDVGALLRQFFIKKLGDCVGDRVHHDHVPQPTAEELAAKKCKLDDPYVWISRSGTDHTDRCLGGSDGTPDEETWDVEVFGPVIKDVQYIARQIQKCDSFQGMAVPGLWLGSLFVEDQADDYRYKGIAEPYIEGGIEVASFLITICPICIDKG